MFHQARRWMNSVLYFHRNRFPYLDCLVVRATQDACRIWREFNGWHCLQMTLQSALQLPRGAFRTELLWLPDPARVPSVMYIHLMNMTLQAINLWDYRGTMDYLDEHWGDSTKNCIIHFIEGVNDTRTTRSIGQLRKIKEKRPELYCRGPRELRSFRTTPVVD